LELRAGTTMGIMAVTATIAIPTSAVIMSPMDQSVEGCMSKIQPVTRHASTRCAVVHLVGLAVLLAGCAAPSPPARLTDTQITALGPPVSYEPETPMSPEERAKQLAASDAAWKKSRVELERRGSAQAQCDYEVASNPLTVNSGILMEIVMYRHLMELCLRAKGL